MTGTWGRRLRDSGICVTLLLVLPLGVNLYFWSDGEVPQSGSALMTLAPWEAHTGWSDGEDSALSAWQLRNVWPSYQFLNSHRSTLSSLPWNPGSALGTPFLADARNRVFSPFSIVFYLFDLGLAVQLSLLLKCIVAGWVGFYVARRYGFTPWYAFIVAFIIQWSGPVFLWGLEPVSDTLVWLPLLLLATDRLLLGQFKSWPGVALIVAVMALSGDLGSLSASLVVMALYMFLRRLRDHRRAHIVGALPGYALGIVAGLGLASVQLWPFIELLRHGNVVDHGYPWTFDGSVLFSLFGPANYQAATGISNPLVHIVFVGVIPLLYVGLWAALRRLIERPIRHRVESLLFATLLVAAIPVVLQELLPGIHGLRFLHPVHYLAGLTLPLALMVAAVSETWLHLNAEQCKRALLRMGAWLPLWWGGLLVAFLWCSRDGSGSLAIHWPSFWVIGGSSLVLALLFGGTLLYPKARIMVAGTLALLVLTTAWGTLPWVVHGPAADLYPETEAIQALQASDARVGGSSRMSGWPLAGNQIPALYSPGTAMLNRTQRFLDQVDASPLLQRRAAVSTLILQKEDIQGAYAAVRPDLNIVDIFDTGLVLFRDKGAFPRYRMVHEVERSPEAQATLQVGGLPVVPGLQLPPVPGTLQDSIRVADVPRNDALDLAVETNHPGVLIIAEAWYPGWRAWVDDTETAILPVDGVFRGVELSAGSHAVRFRYQPGSLRWGALVSLGFVAFFLVGAYLATRRPKRRF